MKKQKIISISALVVGVITLAIGAFFLITRLNSAAKLSDADFLVNIGEWVEDGEDSVIWSFTEVGKGTLTTNGHQNDYDFVWTISEDILKIETDWLYAMDDSFTYELDQNAKKLTLFTESGEINFYPASSVDS